MIGDSIKKVRYNPEIRVETTAKDIPVGKSVSIEEVRNIQGQLPGYSVAVIGFQPQGNANIFHWFSADEELLSDFHSQGFQGINGPDEPFFFMARKSFTIGARNVGATDVTGYKFRTTWVAYKPDELRELVGLPTPVWERFDMIIPPEVRAVVERGFETVRRGVYTYVGALDVGAITVLDIINTAEDQYLVLDMISASQSDNVTVNIYREGETTAGASIAGGFFPANLVPLRMWLPARNELRVEVSASAAVASYVIKVGIRRIRPVDPKVASVVGF